MSKDYVHLCDVQVNKLPGIPLKSALHRRYQLQSQWVLEQVSQTIVTLKSAREKINDLVESRATFLGTFSYGDYIKFLHAELATIGKVVQNAIDFLIDPSRCYSSSHRDCLLERNTDGDKFAPPFRTNITRLHRFLPQMFRPELPEELIIETYLKNGRPCIAIYMIQNTEPPLMTSFLASFAGLGMGNQHTSHHHTSTSHDHQQKHSNNDTNISVNPDDSRIKIISSSKSDNKPKSSETLPLNVDSDGSGFGETRETKRSDMSFHFSSSSSPAVKSLRSSLDIRSAESFQNNHLSIAHSSASSVISHTRMHHGRSSLSSRTNRPITKPFFFKDKKTWCLHDIELTCDFGNDSSTQSTYELVLDQLILIKRDLLSWNIPLTGKLTHLVH